MTEAVSPLPNPDVPVEPAAQGRLDLLKGIFRDAATPVDESVDPIQHYFRNGGCLRTNLAEIEALAGPSEYDQAITTARDDYMAVALTRPNLHNRLVRKRALQKTEATYIDSVVNKIGAVIDADDGEKILSVRQMPSLVEKASFSTDKPLLAKDFAANHLYLLMDTALQEHAKRRAAIDEHLNASLKSRIVGNRVLHIAIAVGIFGASAVPELGVVPTPDEIITSDIEFGLRVLGSAILLLDTPEALRLFVLQRGHDKRTAELQKQLAGNPELSDLALRMAYSSPRYGSSNGFEHVTDRFGTEDKGENLRRFHKLDDEFSRLHGDPGGKPYTGAQSLGYAARFLIERKHELDTILDPTHGPAEQKQAYLALCRSILQEDLSRMKKGLTVSRLRKDTMKLIGVVPAMIFPSFFSTISDAATLSHDTSATLRGKPNRDELED